MEVIEAVRAACGPDFPVGVRVSAEDLEPGGLTLDDTLEVVDALQRSAPADYVSVTTGVRGAYVKDTTFAEGFARVFSSAIKRLVDVPVIVTGRFRTPALAEEVLATGEADFIGLGRALIADPEWVAKAGSGRTSEIRPCVGIVQDCRRSTGLIACTIHALTGREHEWSAASRPARTGRVVVVGGGPRWARGGPCCGGERPQGDAARTLRRARWAAADSRRGADPGRAPRFRPLLRA